MCRSSERARERGAGQMRERFSIYIFSLSPSLYSIPLRAKAGAKREKSLMVADKTRRALLQFYLVPCVCVCVLLARSEKG